jgi:hypothetical protein
VCWQLFPTIKSVFVCSYVNDDQLFSSSSTIR